MDVKTQLQELVNLCSEHNYLDIVFREGKRTYVSKAFFEHTYHFLTHMSCWTEDERKQEWTTKVVYAIPNDSVESDLPSPAVAIYISADETANNIQMDVREEHPNKITIEKQPIETDISLVKLYPGKFYLNASAHFSSIEIHKEKTYVFRSSATWTYIFRVVYKEAYDASENTILFGNTPFYAIHLRCQDIQGEGTVESILCKIKDITR